MSSADDASRFAALPVGTLTFVLTDIEASTQLWDSDPAAMAAAQEQHDTLIAAAVAAHGGRLVKSKGEGDSTFSVFHDPSAAVSAAEAIRDTINGASWPTSYPIRVRVGVLTGVAELRDGDYYGAAVNRAARVRSLAAGGEILLAASTYTLIADSLLRDRVIEDRGEHELRGLQRPEHVYALGDGITSRNAGSGARPGRIRVLLIVGACAVVAGGLGWFAATRHSGGRTAVPPPSAPPTTTSAPSAAQDPNQPSVEISSVELVSAHNFIRYEVSGIVSRVNIPPYEIRVLARSPTVTSTWLWSPPANVGAHGRWTGELDVPEGKGGAPSPIRVSAIAILPGPVSGTTPSGPPALSPTSSITLPPSGPELAYDHQLTARGPAAKGVIAVSPPHTVS